LPKNNKPAPLDAALDDFLIKAAELGAMLDAELAQSDAAVGSAQRETMERAAAVDHKRSGYLRVIRNALGDLVMQSTEARKRHALGI
jgi:hypothetical protein